MSPLAPAKQYSPVQGAPPVQPMQATPLALMVSRRLTELAACIGPSTPTPRSRGAGNIRSAYAVDSVLSSLTGPSPSLAEPAAGHVMGPVRTLVRETVARFGMPREELFS